MDLVVDSSACEGVLISGYSSSPFLAAITGAFWSVGSDRCVGVYVLRVPSRLNLADGFSRGDSTVAVTNGWTPVEAVAPEPAPWQFLVQAGNRRDFERQQARQQSHDLRTAPTVRSRGRGPTAKEEDQAGRTVRAGSGSCRSPYAHLRSLRGSRWWRPTCGCAGSGRSGRPGARASSGSSFSLGFCLEWWRPWQVPLRGWMSQRQ